eukprot:13416565-Alexandrium_andersonii.AAC.1
MRQARKAILNNEEAPINVDPLHPVFPGGHKVTRQVRPHAGGLIDVRPLVVWGLRGLTHSTSMAVG